MEECFLANKATLIRPSGAVSTSREIDIISCLVNGGTVKSSAKVLGISPYTVNAHLRNIRNEFKCSSIDQIIKIVEESDNHIQIRERYIDLLLFSKFQETLKKVNELKISPKYKCVVHAGVEEIDKYILLNYLNSSGINADILYESSDYAVDKFHIICCPENSKISLENLESKGVADNIVISESHNNDTINLSGQCIESNGSGTQYKSYFSLLGCISKIYSSKDVDDILNEFREYYYSKKNKKSSTIPEQNHIKITDQRKTKYVALFFTTLLIVYIATHWHNETHKTHLTNINMLVGHDILLKRKALTSRMDQILEKQKGVKFLVLVGQGGAGKTTLARHYVNKSNAKIKWEINASTKESSLKSFLGLAIELSKRDSKKREELKYIQATEDTEIKRERIISFVFFQLNKLESWHLLFDNVDNFKMIYGFIPSNKDLCDEGTIIITTRNANGSNASFISDDSVLNIEYLEKGEVKKLFCDILYGKKAPSQSSEELDKFLENIPPMPLDVSNAAYYIKNTSSSFEKYLEILRSPNEETERLHSKFLNEGTEYNKTRYKMTVAAFDKLIEINPNFKELLLFICLLDSKNIPRKYLEQCREFVIVSDFLQNLKRFLSISLEEGAFSIHKSIQEIGLVYLSGLLTNIEKEIFLKKIINIMTPYSSILWQKYKTYPRKLEGKDLNELETHMKSMVNNIKTPNLLILEKDRYIAKLLLAIGFIYGEDNIFQSKHFLNEALKYNGNNKYIENYEYAIALLTLGYDHLYLDELEDAKLWLNNGLEFCKNLKGAEILKAYGLCDLGKCYAKTNEFDQAVVLLENALSIVDDNQEDWARNTASQICWGLSHAYADHYINKIDGNKAIAYAQKSFEKLGLERYSYNNKIGDIKKNIDDLVGDSYWCLAKAYNRSGKYNNAQKCELCYYDLYEKYFKNEDHIFDKVRVDIEYGYTLLRKGELASALNILNRAINKKEELNDDYYLFHALVSRTEVLIRLNKLDEAYTDFQYAISKKGNSADNYTKLLVCTCLYHAFIIKCKKKDYKLALGHFSDFCISINEFCKGFLSASAYNSLLNANAFEIIRDESQIKVCLQNSLKIFSSIYGKGDPFVENYVSRNECN